MSRPSKQPSIRSGDFCFRTDILIISRARDVAHARHLYTIGVTDAVPETIEASLQLSEASLIRLGQDTGLVIAPIHESAMISP